MVIYKIMLRRENACSYTPRSLNCSYILGHDLVDVYFPNVYDISVNITDLHVILLHHVVNLDSISYLRPFLCDCRSLMLGNDIESPTTKCKWLCDIWYLFFVLSSYFDRKLSIRVREFDDVDKNLVRIFFKCNCTCRKISRYESVNLNLSFKIRLFW